MRATGIVRRIDDLGRVVVPREIRRTLRINDGDPLEIFTDDEGSVIFRKYQPVPLTELEKIVETLVSLEITPPHDLYELIKRQRAEAQE